MNIKKRSVNRALSLLICMTLAVSSTVIVPVSSYASAECSDTEVVKGMAYNAASAPDIVYYSDALFRGDSMEYNTSLAALSFAVCNASYRTGRSTTETQSRNLRELLEDNGFTDYEVSEDYTKEPDLESSAVACAHKQITDNGRTYTLLAVIPRSGTAGDEFVRTLFISKSGNDGDDHCGYRQCSRKVIDFVRSYTEKYGLKGNVKVWTTGYSGGAGVSNLFAAELIRSPYFVLGTDLTFDPSDLYAYEFSPLRIAAPGSDPKNSQYDCIHNIYENTDLLMHLIPECDFDRYGSDYHYTDYTTKEKALEFMKIDRPSQYSAYIGGQDPDLFTRYKIDAAELIENKKLVTVPDEDTELSCDQAEYLDSVSRTIAQICAQEGDGDSRKGYEKSFQEPLQDLVGYFFRDGLNTRGISLLMKALTGTDNSVPLILCMYTSALVNKSMNDQSAELNAAVEEGFNRLADAMEDGNGSLKSDQTIRSAYYEIRDRFFETDEEGSRRLKNELSLSAQSELLKNLKKLTSYFYAKSFGAVLEEAEVDQETIEDLTSEENSAGVSWFLANLLFINADQSEKTDPLDPENEQFDQLATFTGNISRYITMHMFMSLFSWLRAADPYYDDFCKGNAAQIAGYRRVYIDQDGKASVSGTVTDGDGRTVASFKDGRITSRSDEWIGITASDSGNWLRLPVDKSYKVTVGSRSDALIGMRVADYSVADGEEKRVVSGDASGNWTSLKVNASDSIVLDIPAVKGSDGSYDLTSAEYSLSRVEPSSGSAGDSGIYSASVPSVKKIKVSSGKRNFTVKWKKLTKGQRKKASRIELQYSTDQSFKTSVKTKRLSTKKSAFRVKNLKKGMKYYVRLRIVRNKNGKKYVSRWSKAKGIKIK